MFLPWLYPFLPYFLGFKPILTIPWFLGISTFFRHKPSHLHPDMVTSPWSSTLCGRICSQSAFSFRRSEGSSSCAASETQPGVPSMGINLGGFAGENLGKIRGKPWETHDFPWSKQKMLGKMRGSSTMRGENDDEHDGKMMGETWWDGKKIGENMIGDKFWTTMNMCWWSLGFQLHFNLMIFGFIWFCNDRHLTVEKNVLSENNPAWG